MSRTQLCVSAVAALILSAGALGAITVLPAGTPFTVDGSNNITIDASSLASTSSVTVASTNSLDSVNNITVNLPSSSSAYIVLNVNSTVRSLHGIAKGTGSAELWIGTLDVFGEIGAYNSGAPSGLIKANRVDVKIASGRNIFADIEMTGSSLSAGKTIERIDVTDTNREYYGDGGLYGSVLASAGNIGDITTVSAIGAGSPITIQAVSGDINLVSAAAFNALSIYANNGNIGTVGTTEGGWGGDGTIPRVLITPGSTPPTPGTPLSVGGDLTAKKLDFLRLLKGNFQGTLTVTDPMVTNAVWKIGGSLTSAARINLPANGLKGQIVINSNLQSGAYDGKVKVGATELANDYNRRPDTLGNGSAGKAAYIQNNADSSAFPGSYILDGSIDPNDLREPPPCEYHLASVKLGFYGNLNPASVSAADITVERRPLSENPDCASDFGWSSLGISPTVSGRIMTVSRTGGLFTAGYRYRLTLANNKLKVAGGDLTDASANSYVNLARFCFDVYDGCQQKFNLNGRDGVNAADVAIWLAEPRDFDDDGAANNRDLGSMLEFIGRQPQ